MTRLCNTCHRPVEEAFDIPWLGKFYRCDDGHVEVREPEGGRVRDDEDAIAPLRSCYLYANKFVPKARNNRGVVGEDAAPSGV
jgi:hypothetical protein